MQQTPFRLGVKNAIYFVRDEISGVLYGNSAMFSHDA